MVAQDHRYASLSFGRRGEHRHDHGEVRKAEWDAVVRREVALCIGPRFEASVASAPHVRSSYHAGELLAAGGAP